jgi:hypothetical protein
MYELTNEELMAVTGNGGALLSGCGACGASAPAIAAVPVATPVVTGPFISAFSNQNAVQFAAQTAVQQSVANQNAYYTQWG